MKTYENPILIELKSAMYELARAKYDNQYSSSNYEPRINLFRTKCATLFDLCNILELNISDITVDYCGYVINIDDLISFEDLVLWV